jgi:hypothetical protein
MLLRELSFLGVEDEEAPAPPTRPSNPANPPKAPAQRSAPTPAKKKGLFGR